MCCKKTGLWGCDKSPPVRRDVLSTAFAYMGPSNVALCVYRRVVERFSSFYIFFVG